MIVVAAKFTGKPERRNDILQLASVIAPLSQSERGCISYNFYEQQPASNEYLFFEEWESQGALDAHFQTPHFLDFMKQFPALIEGAPQLRVYEVSSFRNL